MTPPGPLDLPASLTSLLAPDQAPDGPGRHAVVLASGRAAELALAPAAQADLLDAEAARLRWLDGRASTPRLLDAGRSAAAAYLLMEALPGHAGDDRDMALSGPEVARSLGGALAALHALPVAGCPFHRPLPTLLAEARHRVASDAIATEELAPAYRRYGPRGLFDLLERSLPPGDLAEVVGHGDLRLSDVVVEGPEQVGLRRFTRLAVCDPYLDLASAVVELLSVYGPGVLVDFTDGYGVARPNAVKLDFFCLLRELL